MHLSVPFETSLVTNPDNDEKIKFNKQCPFFIFNLDSLSRFEMLVKNVPDLSNFNLAHTAVLVQEPSNQTQATEVLGLNIFKRYPNLAILMPTFGTSVDSFAIFARDIVFQSKIVVDLIDVWKNGRFCKNAKIFSRPMLNLQGQTYSAATFVLPPFTARDPKTGEYSGLEV